MTSPTPTEQSLSNIRGYIQTILGEYKDDVFLAASEVVETKNTIDSYMDQFESRAQAIIDGTDNLTIRVALVDTFHERINNKADKTHTHVSTDIIDSGPDPVPGAIVRRGPNSRFSVLTPTDPTHPTSLGYIDERLSEVASSTHTHTSLDITDGEDSSTGGASSGKVVKWGVDGLIRSTVNPTHADHLTRKAFVDLKADITFVNTELGKKANTSHTHTIANVTNLQTTLNGKASTSHTHTSSDISNATDVVSGLVGNAGQVVKTGTDGQLSVTTANITKEEHVTSRGYVDTGLSGKANSSHTHTIANVTGLQSALDGKSGTTHTHTMSQITDLPTVSSGVAASRLVQRDGSGNVLLPNTPTSDSHASSKLYTDQKVAKSGATSSLWTGTQSEYDGLPDSTRNAAGFVAVVV